MGDVAHPPLNADALPLYAAPIGAARPARMQFTAQPHTARHRVYGHQAVAREVPWLDAIERWMLAYNRWHATVATPVTRANSTISSRVNRPAHEIEAVLAALGAPGRRQVGRATLDFHGPDRDGGQRATVRLAWSWPALAVVISTRPWSSGRCDLVLELAGSRRIHFPRRWFPAGHAIIDELRRAVS